MVCESAVSPRELSCLRLAPREVGSLEVDQVNQNMSRYLLYLSLSNLSSDSSGLVRRTLISSNVHIIRMFLVTSYLIPCFQNPPVGVRWVRLPSPPRQRLRQPFGELQVDDNNGCHLWVYYLCPQLLICTYININKYIYIIIIYAYPTPGVKRKYLFICFIGFGSN